MTTKPNKQPFWRTKSLAQLSQLEWESLCDGCGKCCLNKLEDEDTDELLYTNVACSLLDIPSCRCTRYADRCTAMPGCLDLYADFPYWHWLPVTCAYRLLAQGGDLPDWHPLLCGNSNTVPSVRDFAILEHDAIVLEDHVIEWLN